eukprot:CAMPEP_0178996452 /NCGR_PEP_ID=MMETSP0795-20121207/8373_1 /TAXON_ID=88552 /ORGANISM="Amoebophrya sp., Strain Ameob2" /LENGTH=987 /DNA_ID=CAMNT_0020688837 /DNA_START=336 /DNA_END=3300 /DNA_ORIENTATION=+
MHMRSPVQNSAAQKKARYPHGSTGTSGRPASGSPEAMNKGGGDQIRLLNWVNSNQGDSGTHLRPYTGSFTSPVSTTMNPTSFAPAPPQMQTPSAGGRFATGSPNGSPPGLQMPRFAPSDMMGYSSVNMNRASSGSGAPGGAGGMSIQSIGAPNLSSGGSHSSSAVVGGGTSSGGLGGYHHPASGGAGGQNHGGGRRQKHHKQMAVGGGSSASTASTSSIGNGHNLMSGGGGGIGGKVGGGLSIGGGASASNAANVHAPEYNFGPPREAAAKAKRQHPREEGEAAASTRPRLDADPEEFGGYLERLPDPPEHNFNVQPDHEHEAMQLLDMPPHDPNPSRDSPDPVVVFSPVEQTRLPSQAHNVNTGPGPQDRYTMDVTIPFHQDQPGGAAAATSSRDRDRERERRRERREQERIEQTILPVHTSSVGSSSGGQPPAQGQLSVGSSKRDVEVDFNNPFFEIPGGLGLAIPGPGGFNLSAPGLNGVGTGVGRVSTGAGGMLGSLPLDGGAGAGGLQMPPNSARGANLNTLDGWINNQNVGRIETVDQQIIDNVSKVAINRPLRRDFTDFSQEIKEVFPQETLDLIFQRSTKGASKSGSGGSLRSQPINSEDIKKFAGGGLNHEFIMTGPGPQGKLLIKVIAVRNELPGASQGEAVETEYLRKVCPDLPNDRNVSFPIASYRGIISQSKKSKSRHDDYGLAAPKYYDIVVLNFVEGCINIRDLVSAYDKAPADVQAQLLGPMRNLIGHQIPQLFHRYYLKHMRKMGDGKADNILLDKSGHLVMCDIGSTFNAVIRPCDKGEFLRSLQASHQESPVNELKQCFDRYFACPPEHNTVNTYAGFPDFSQKKLNAELAKQLQPYVHQKGGLLRAMPRLQKNEALANGVKLEVPNLVSGLNGAGDGTAGNGLLGSAGALAGQAQAVPHRAGDLVSAGFCRKADSDEGCISKRPPTCQPSVLDQAGSPSLLRKIRIDADTLLPAGGCNCKPTAQKGF